VFFFFLTLGKLNILLAQQKSFKLYFCLDQFEQLKNFEITT